MAIVQVDTIMNFILAMNAMQTYSVCPLQTQAVTVLNFVF